MHAETVSRTLPTRFQERLLRVLLAPAAEARQLWEQLEPDFDLDRLDPSAFHVMPMLHARLQQLALTSDLLPRLAGLRRHTWYRGEMSARRTCELLCALEQGGVAPLLLDGPVLAARLYPEAGLRTPGEPVVLVRRHDRAGALRALAGIGFQGQHRTAHLRAVIRTQRLVDPDGFVVQLGTEQVGLLRGPLEPEALWACADRILLHDREHLVPSLQHLLLLLLQPHHRAAGDRRCVWPLDAVRVLAHPHFDPVAFGALSERAPSGWAGEPLAYLEHRLGQPMPEGLSQSRSPRRLLDLTGEGPR